MNKAFSREQDADADDDEDEQLAEGKSTANTRNYVTPAGYEKIKVELDHLLKHERPKMVEVVTWAASNGDRSENGDYIYGKKRLREIDRRIRYLTRQMGRSVVVDPLLQTNTDQVFFGATVSILDKEGDSQIYSIVGLDEADASRNRLSWTSPLARALIGAHEGDLIRFQSPAGWREIEIIEISYEAIE